MNSIPDEEIELVYQQCQKKMESLQAKCDACGKCCHFNSYGHRLYASTGELAYLKKHKPLTSLSNGDSCPYLKDNLCSAREHRMLGCRIFFSQHTKAQEEEANLLYEELLKKLKELHLKYHVPWNYVDVMTAFPEESGLPTTTH